VVAAASYEARAFGIHSAMPAAQAKRLCPRALFLRPDFARYREESEQIFALFRRFTPVIQTVALDEAYLDVTEHLGEHGTATAVAEAIRRAVRDERRLTVSVGVGPNRLVAKIASDRKKPDGLCVVPPPRVVAFLAPLPARVLQGVGPATARALTELGVETVGELRALSRERLIQRFGRHGETLYRYARGIDDRPVRTHRQRKSLGAERTFARDLADLREMNDRLTELADGVGRGLAGRGLLGATVTVKVRYADFTTVTRAQTLPHPTDDPSHIAAVARELLRKTEAGRRPVRLLGVTLARLGGEEPQLSLFAEGLVSAAESGDGPESDRAGGD
jgi:DNA polymerase-4